MSKAKKKTTKRPAKKPSKKPRAKVARPPARKRPRRRRESRAARIERAGRIVEVLETTYPDAHCALNYRNPLELLIATILSAQCTDKRVNIVTEKLFKTYRKPVDYVAAPLEALEEAVRTTGFFRSKARAIRECCRDIVEKHGGEVPRTLEELTKLRGVGRKTGNVVLGNAFDIPGLVVDTHVKRIANRLDLTVEEDPVKIEFELMGILPREKWTYFSHRVIWHGRGPCKARKPSCGECTLAELCPSAT